MHKVQCISIDYGSLKQDSFNRHTFVNYNIFWLDLRAIFNTIGYVSLYVWNLVLTNRKITQELKRNILQVSNTVN